MSSKAYSTATTADQRVQLETTGGGQFVGPGAFAVNPGALGIQTGQLSTVNLSGKYSLGMSGAEVSNLLSQQALFGRDVLASQNAAVDKISALATNALSTQAALPADWQKYIPYALAAAVVMAVWGKGRRRAA
jgi:hypothetical protein